MSVFFALFRCFLFHHLLMCINLSLRQCLLAMIKLLFTADCRASSLSYLLILEWVWQCILTWTWFKLVKTFVWVIVSTKHLFWCAHFQYRIDFRVISTRSNIFHLLLIKLSRRISSCGFLKQRSILFCQLFLLQQWWIILVWRRVILWQIRELAFSISEGALLFATCWSSQDPYWRLHFVISRARTFCLLREKVVLRANIGIKPRPHSVGRTWLWFSDVVQTRTNRIFLDNCLWSVRYHDPTWPCFGDMKLQFFQIMRQLTDDGSFSTKICSPGPGTWFAIILSRFCLPILFTKLLVKS